MWNKTLKRTALIVLCTFAFSHASQASQYGAKCLNHKGKFDKCNIDVTADTVKVSYKSKKNKDLDVEIPGKNITALSAGEYARRRVAESVTMAILLTPLALFTLFSKKKRDHIGVEYLDASGKPKGTLFEVKKKYGMALKTELKALSGKEIEEKKK